MCTGVDDFLTCQLTKRRSQASAFGQLMSLVSDGRLDLEQKEAYGSITVKRGELFDADAPEVMGVAATIKEAAEEAEEEEDAAEEEEVVTGVAAETEDDWAESPSD